MGSQTVFQGETQAYFFSIELPPGDATGVPLVVRGVVDLGRPRPVRDRRGEAGVSLDGRRGMGRKSPGLTAYYRGGKVKISHSLADISNALATWQEFYYL